MSSPGRYLTFQNSEHDGLYNSGNWIDELFPGVNLGDVPDGYSHSTQQGNKENVLSVFTSVQGWDSSVDDGYHNTQFNCLEPVNLNDVPIDPALFDLSHDPQVHVAHYQTTAIKNPKAAPVTVAAKPRRSTKNRNPPPRSSSAKVTKKTARNLATPRAPGKKNALAKRVQDLTL